MDELVFYCMGTELLVVTPLVTQLLVQYAETWGTILYQLYGQVGTFIVSRIASKNE